ncbi:hypothetical protein ILT44_23340 [Microvirga sp. BT689]|uniref:hypothetical protein n=1 Tax=Microvirga arvi TaxID=2778731 RepID=UPI00194E87FF|nr:hypothetical protein [Microvirga arvi]MBM6583140.1 hypothetical protein [Microvirga arvi]
MSKKIPDDLYHNLERDLPLALLPVRLEVRFGTRPIGAAGSERAMPVLRVRIYPDEISVRDHKPDLTALEVEAGQAYWDDLARAGENAGAAERAFWEQLSRRVGPYRAAHVAHLTRGGYAGTLRSGRSPPTADILPDHWVVTAWAAGKRVLSTISGPVRKPLAVGPRQDDQYRLSLDPRQGLKFDAETRWLADYADAEAAGMAVTVDLAHFDEAGNETVLVAVGSTIDRLLVFGLRETLADGESAETEAKALADLIGQHKVRHGARFLPQGTPTNNLKGARSGWQSRPDPQALRAIEAPPPDPFPTDVLRGGGTNAQVLAAALGLPAGALSDLEFANLREQSHARLMNEALFPVTWGELLGNLFMPTRVEMPRDDGLVDGLDDAYRFGRAHFRDYVRGRGPLPALLLGRQPYGVLPITDPAAWSKQEGEPATLIQLTKLLADLRPFWSYAAKQAPELPHVAPDIDAASRRLLEIMGTGPVPHPRSYGVSTVTGQLGTLVASGQKPLPFVDSNEQTTFKSLSATVTSKVYQHWLAVVCGLPKDARILDFEREDPLLLTIPSVADTAGVAPADYLKKLTEAAPKTLMQPGFWAGQAPSDLLSQLLIRSLLLANEQSALALVKSFDRGIHFDLISQSPELAMIEQAGKPSRSGVISMTFDELAIAYQVQPAGSLTAEARQTSLSDLVFDVQMAGLAVAEPEGEGPPTTQAFMDTQKAVLGLYEAAMRPERPDGLAAADFERLLGETLATCATRLDAWITSVATRRLDWLRLKRQSGLRIGAYGWLVDLPREPMPEPLPEQLEGWDVNAPQPVTPRKQVGWVHAPSLAQAETAAVLRSAELSHDDGTGSTVARIDLTSTRIRVGKDILDAVQNGQSIGAVLGYRLERALQDANRAHLIQALRDLFPQQSVPRTTDDPEQVVPRDVVDGERAWSAWRSWNIWRADINQNPPGGFSREKMRQYDPVFKETDAVLRSIDAAVEAVSDLLVAEGVHNIVSGDHERAAATLRAAAYGEPLPGGLEVIRTPRSGQTITHRVVLVVEGSNPNIPGWNDEAPRARLSPELERWARRLLGRADRWEAEVYTGKADGSEELKKSVNLAKLQPSICALDVIYEASGGEAAQSLLADRIVANAQLAGGRVRQIPNAEFSWDQLIALAGAARDVLLAARPLTQQDLQLPGEDPAAAPSEAVLAHLKGKVEEARQRFRTALTNLEAAYAQQADADAIKQGLERLAEFGVPGASLPPGAAVVQRVDAVIAGARVMLRTADDALQARENEKRPLLDRLTTTAQALLGPMTVLLPRLTSPPQLGPDSVPAHVDRSAIEQWISRTGRVRSAVAALKDLREFSTFLGAKDLSTHIAQLPPKPQDNWLAGPLKVRAADPDMNPLRRFETIGGPRIHMLIFTDGSALPDDITGLVLDEWTEAIPAVTQNTGVSLHYNAPNARAPQSLLLAVHPNPDEQPWSWSTIEAMLGDTLALARLRTVELPQLRPTAVDEYLPAIYARDGFPNTDSLHRIARHWLLSGEMSQWLAANQDMRLKNG